MSAPIYTSFFFIAFGVFIIIFSPVASFISKCKAYKTKRRKQRKDNTFFEQLEKYYRIESYNRVVELANKQTIDLNRMDSGYMLLKLGDSYFKIGEPNKAIETLQTALSITSRGYEKERINECLGEIYYSNNEYEKALLYFEKLSQSYILDTVKYGIYHTLLLMGKTYYLSGQYELAIETFRKAPIDYQLMTAELKEVIYYVALSYEMKGENEMAQHYFKQVYAADTSFKNINEKLSGLPNVA